MLKSFEEMRKVEIKTEDRDGFDYLNWAECVKLLHESGAEKVYFQPIVNEQTGSSLFMTPMEFVDKNKVTNRCYEVGVHIVIDDLEFDMRGPLMNGTNPVKDNSISQQRIWNCQTRLFVKGVAIRTGLGFDLWLKEEGEGDLPTKMDDPFAHSLPVIKDRIQQLVTAKMDSGMSLADIAVKTGIGKTKDDVNDIFRQIVRINNFETDLRAL